MTVLNAPTLVSIAVEFYAKELAAARAAELTNELGPMNDLVSARAHRLGLFDEPAGFKSFTDALD